MTIKDSAVYPTMDLVTPYGTLTIAWLDPQATRDSDKLFDKGSYHTNYDNQPEYNARGILTINGITLNIQEYYRFMPEYKDCEPTGRMILRSTTHYNRRTDGKEWDWTAGYAKKFHSEIPELVAEFVIQYPELKTRARRVSLHNLTLQANKLVDAARVELAKAEDRANKATSYYVDYTNGLF